MTPALAADAVLALHAAFIAFVVLGGLLVLRWPRVAWLHLPAACWGALVEFTGWTCPLTPLEQALRRAAGNSGYDGGFLAHYLLPLIYPAGLTREIGIVLGIGVVLVNALVYALVVRRARQRTGRDGARPGRIRRTVHPEGSPCSRKS